jgi:hypothetical protein
MLRSTILGALVAPLLGACMTVPTIQWAPPPHELLLDCPIPNGPIPTNGDLARRDAARKAALVACNADKAALREWAKDKK